MKPCPKCGGIMILVDQYADGYMCDTCWYEINLDGVINEGDKEDDK
jgi:DNA-directed RNA polymerase subunit M/transcription elongation factor TFIIS